MTPTHKLTPAQRGIMLHALGLREDGKGREYRNHFVTGPGSDYDDCEALAAAGFMRKRSGNALTGGDPCYFVTEAGRKALEQAK